MGVNKSDIDFLEMRRDRLIAVSNYKKLSLKVRDKADVLKVHTIVKLDRLYSQKAKDIIELALEKV